MADRNVIINIQDVIPKANTAYVDPNVDNLTYNKQQVDAKISDSQEGIKQTAITPNTALATLNSLENGIYRASGAGSYKFSPSIVIIDGQSNNIIPDGYDVKFVKSSSGWARHTVLKMPTLSAEGKVEEGNTEAVSGGEVFENIKPLDLLVLKQGTNIANDLGVLNKDSVNVTKDLLLTKLGNTASAVNYNITSLLNITQDLDLKIRLYGANASICFYDSNNSFLEGYSKTDLGNMGLLTGDYLTVKISQITTNSNVNKFRFCFFDNDGTIINEIKLTKDELKNNTLSVLNFKSEVAINSKAVENMSTSISEMENVQIDLINEISELKLELEVEKESKEALFIEQATLQASSDCPTNPTTLITPTNVVGNVVNGDFSVWGGSKIIMIAVEYSDGTHGNHLVESFTSTECVLVDVPSKTIVKLQSMHDAVLGQHLTELGYKALAERLWSYNKRTAFKSKLIKSVAFNDHEKDSTLVNGYYGIRNITTLNRDLEFKLLNSYPIAWVSINELSQTYFINNSPRLTFYPSSTIGAGISIKYNSKSKGFSELYLGTNMSHAGSGILEVKKAGVTVFSQVFKGAVKRIIVPLDIGNYEFEIKVNESVNVAINLSSISFWHKREISEPIFKKSDKVLFITDSWGEYPITTIESEKGIQYNGVKARDGKCTMPEHFRSLFVANGGQAEDVQYCTRGGFTTEWALHWLNDLINTVNPTKIVFHFGINDRNSRNNYPSTASVYDFDKENIFLEKLYSNGGGFGSVNKDKFTDNLLELKRICISRGVIPIFFMMPIVAVAGQSASLMEWNRDIMWPGF